HHGDARGHPGPRGRRDEPHLPGTRRGTRGSEERLRATHGAIEADRGGGEGIPATGGATETPRSAGGRPTGTCRTAEGGPSEIHRGAEGRPPAIRELEAGHQRRSEALDSVSGGLWGLAGLTPKPGGMWRILVHGLANGKRGPGLQCGDPGGEGRSAE